MLVGRKPEQRLIAELVAAARTNQSRVLVVTGDAGVGKTALLEEAVTLADGMRVLWARGTETESDIPFSGLQQILQPMLPKLGEIPGPQAEALGAALALHPGSPPDRFAVGAATLNLICRFVDELPLLLLVDDLQFMDRPSVDALGFAARRLVADPIAVMAAERTDPAAAGDGASPLPDVPHLPLAGIDLQAAAELMVAATGNQPEPSSVEFLHRATGGNPLALIELARSPHRWGSASPAAPLPVSSTLVRAFAERTRRLAPAARLALQVAAVAGSDVRVIIETCAALGLSSTALATAQESGLLRIHDGRVDFRHPLMRSAVYSDLAGAERRRIHRAVAGATAPEDLDARVWHLAESTLIPDAGVAGLLERLGDRAAARGAPAVAATAYLRSARLSPLREDNHRRLIQAARSAWLGGSGERALTLLDEISPAPGPAALRTAVLKLRGAIAARTGSLTESLRLLTAAAIEAPDPDSAMISLAAAVNTCFYLGDAASARDIVARLEALPSGTTTRAQALGAMGAGMGRILANEGGVEQIRRGMDLLAASIGWVDDPQDLSWLLLGPLWLRESDTGSGLRGTLADARQQASIGALPFLLFHIARDEATTDNWRRGEATYSEGIRFARETGQTTELAMSLAGLAWLQARTGKESECLHNAEESTVICKAREIHLGRVWLHSALGDLHAGHGDTRRALAEYELAGDVLASTGLRDIDLYPGPERVELLSSMGRKEEARHIARLFLSQAEAKGQPWSLARAHRALAVCGEDDSFDADFRSALVLHGDTLDVFETARTRLAYGARLRRARRRVDARPPLREALATFESLGAIPWAARASAELRATGESVRQPDLPPARSLTPQELQISLHLAEGKTTRETAEALFLSPKTVEYHLRKVYIKLGIGSRTELAAAISLAGGTTAS